MSNCIAERKLYYTTNANSERKEVVVRIGQPYIVKSGTVNFPVDEYTAGCSIEVVGLPEEFSETTYGADLVQALQLATNIDPILKRLSKKYMFYFVSGEPYFEEENEG